jgi:RNA-binding protein
MLTQDQKKYLRSLAHGRGVILRIGQNGLTDNILAELNQALDHHELVKAGIRVGDREARDAVVKAMVEHSGAEPVQKIGNTVVLFRRNRAKPVIKLPGSG